MREVSSFSYSTNLKLVREQQAFASKMQYSSESYQIGHNIIQAIHTSRDPQTMLLTMAMELGKFFQVDACLIFAGISPANLVHTGFWDGNDSHHFLSSENTTQMLSHPVVTDVLTKNDSIAIFDLQRTEQEYTLAWPETIPNSRSLLIIATRFQGTANGIIVIGQSQPREWSSQEKESLKMLSESVAIGISTIQFQQQTKNNNRYQILLKKIGEKIRSNEDTDSLVYLILAETAKSLEVDRGLVLMLKYKNPLLNKFPPENFSEIEVQLACQWSVNDNSLGRSPNKLSFLLSDSLLCQQAFKSSPKPLILYSDANFPDVESINLETTSALLMMPLMGNKLSESKPPVVLGFLVLQQYQPRIWQPDELELVNWISTQTSNAVLQDQALHQVQSIVDRRTAQQLQGKLKWSLEVQAKLSEKMRQQIEQLRQLNQLKDKFVENISHNLRTPLTQMKIALELLRQPGRPPERQARYLDILEKAWNREHKLIQDLLALQKLESNTFTFHPQQIDLKQIINELAKSVKEQWSQEKELILKVNYHLGSKSKSSPSSPLILYTDPKSVKQILLELLTNAGKYSDSNTVVHLDICQRIKMDGSQIILTLTNYGAGISPEEQAYIFDKFRRGQWITEKEIPGIGVGLTLVKYLVEHLNGTIDVSSYPSENPSTYVTCFTLVLPQFPQKQE